MFALKKGGQALRYYKSLLHVTTCYVVHFVALNLLVSGSPMWSIYQLAMLWTVAEKIKEKQLSYLSLTLINVSIVQNMF